MRLCVLLQLELAEEDMEVLVPQFPLMLAKVENYWQHLVSVHLCEPAKDETAQ